jgi:hypothetical protein
LPIRRHELQMVSGNTCIATLYWVIARMGGFQFFPCLNQVKKGVISFRFRPPYIALLKKMSHKEADPKNQKILKEIHIEKVK